MTKTPSLLFLLIRSSLPTSLYFAMEIKLSGKHIFADAWLAAV